MGDSKFCLLLLLSTSALTFAQEEEHPTCLLAKRYKTLHKYEYQYEAESLNAINGASQLKNGPKASCKVEIEVPQTCSFIVRTTGCTLSEVVDSDAEGNPVFGPAASSDAFAAEMERNPLKVVVEGEYDVKLYPEDGETTTILNFKRGIISALAVPLIEEDKNKNMPTIHGKCKTYYNVNAREDIATDITLNRDLSRCDQFVPMRDHNSPLALITGMHYPLAQLVKSSQTCNYKFDNEKKHMTSGSCTENHILIPFSHKGKYGVTNVGKQELTLIEMAPYNERVFDRNDNVKYLHMEAVEDKSAVQDKEAALNLLRELVTLPETEGEKRAHLFHALVSMVRGMKTETLSPAIPEAVGVSRFLTYQVLAQCGTPECSSAIMQILRTFDTTSLEVDATIFALGLMSNPSALLINDMLEMAKYKQSKPIMYALSNVVKRFFKAEGKVTPEIHSVAEFLVAELGDCSGEKDKTFMTLRVIGNMAPAVIPISPALRNAVIQCVKQPAASQSVQQAAIQVYRQIPVPEEDREVFMQVLLDKSNPVQERIAAYLVLMKDPQPSELTQLINAVSSEEDEQMKSFVMSHINNIRHSTGPETSELRQKIFEATQTNEIGSTVHPISYSQNYKMGSMEGNMIFEGTSYLPKEVMLDMTLKAFGFEIDMMEIGMEGKGFEPTVDALFGENGFFPDTALKTMYFVSDNMPDSVSEILQNIMPALKKNRMKREASQNLMKEIGNNLNKLVGDLKAAESPEAMVYLRLLGNELGYLRTNDIEEMTYSAGMMIDSMLKMFPHEVVKALLTSPDSTIFAHYIFMDNEFFLPTVTGVPLRIALSGTFTPGFKGGLQIARDMSTVTFMPSAGIEFVTQVGSHLPEYVNSGLEMHTNIFHESGITAKISMGRDHVKLTIPAPTKPTKLIKMTNTLVAVTGSEVKTIPPLVTDKVVVNECTPVFAGMKYCSSLQYTDAFSHETAPYFPFTGDSKFAVEFHPTGEVSEYTATVAYELLREGEEGRQKVDSLKLILRAEGADPTEATAIMKFNRRKNVITADIQIPDYDVEAGIRLGVDAKTKGKGTHAISLDFINKNIPTLSLVGRANLKAMKEGMLQIELLVPSLNADATLTANMKHDEELELELESEIKLMDAVSEQKIQIKYDTSKIEVQVESDVNTKTTSLPNGEFIEKYGNDILDMEVGQTDMKVRHIFKKFVEAANNYMDNYGAQVLPYMQHFRLPEMPEISMPEKLFLSTKAKAEYLFNNERFTIVIPMPLGGKSTAELNFPPALSTPSVSLPKFGLEIVSMEIPIPNVAVPESFTLSIPLFGQADLSATLTSNLYDMESSLSVGKDVVEPPSYSAKFDLKGNSPIDILSLAVEGTGMVANTDSIKAQLKGSLAHKFIEAKISIEEDAVITNKINLKSISKIEAASPFGLDIKLEHTGMAGLNAEEMTGDNNFEGMFKAGPIYGKTTSVQSFSIFPFRPEAKIDSRVEFDSTVVKANNVIAASLANGEFSLVSNTNAFEDAFTHAAELAFKENKLSMKCDASALALGMKIRNQAEAAVGAGEITVRLETNGDHSENRVYSLLTTFLDGNGLAVNCDANVKLLENEAMHKGTLKMNKDGLITSGTTTLHSPLSLENTFNAGLDATKGTLSVTNKAAMYDMKVDNTNTLTVTLSGLDFSSKAEVSASEYASYTHDVTFDLKPYTASANVNNHLKLLTASFINEAQLQAKFYQMDLTGNMKAVNGEEEIKHTYQIAYADLSGTAKCSTIGKLFGTQMNQNTELEVIGLAARFSNDARFNSQPMRFDHNIRCSFVPFDVSVDAIFNADGDMTMYGKHSAQLFGKFLLRAQPLAFASSHECRASVTHQLDNGFSLETTYDNKMDTSLTPQEQKTSLKIKSKINDHAFNQDIEVYNIEERTGVEVSGNILTNILNTASTEKQEFIISAFLKYDKNTDSHVIHIPLINNLPVFMESIKGFVVYVAEALQDFINNEDVKARLEALPQHISDFVAQMDVEGKVVQLKQYFTDLTQNFAISMDDVEASLNNLKITVERLLADLAVYIQNFAGMIKDTIGGSNFPENVIQKVQEVLNFIDEAFNIKSTILYVIDTIGQMISGIDLEKLKGSSIALLQDIDDKYQIKATLLESVVMAKEFIETFDMSEFVADVKKIFFSIQYKAVIEDLVAKIPTDILNDIINRLKTTFEDYDIIGKINTFYAKLRDLFMQLEVDKKIQAVLEKTVELFKQLKIEESIQAAIKIIKDADVPTKFMQIFQDATNYLKATEIRDIIGQLNSHIETTVQKLKSLDYNEFVDYTNQIIVAYTSYLNEIIRKLEIPQKLEATREFANVVLSSIQGFVERLREIRVADAIKTVQDVFEQVVCDPLERFADSIKEEIKDLDFKPELTFYLNSVSKYYAMAISAITDLFNDAFRIAKEIFPEQKIISEIQQIIDALLTELKKIEIIIPSFSIPLTDFVVPSMKFDMDSLQQFEIPTQLDIPEFTIMGVYTVKATTISFDDIKQKIIALIDFIVNLKIEILDVNAFFGDLTLNYLPTMPEITLPEFTLPEIEFPTIPQVPVEKLVTSLQVPEFKLPTIPNEIMVPCFGKLYGEIKLQTPIYTIKTSAELKNSTETAITPLLTGAFTSHGTSSSLEMLDYKLDTSARISMPKRKRIVLAETVKFTHVALGVEHQGSVNFYGLSAQAQAKTTAKVTTAPYTAEFMNTAFIGVEGGATATAETTYSHIVDIPIAEVKSEVTVSQKSLARQQGFTLTVESDNKGKGKFNAYDSNHDSKLEFSATPSLVSLSFSGDTDSPILKLKQLITAESATFSHYNFNVRNEAEAPAIKNSLIVISGRGSRQDMKIELKVNHDTELHGADSGKISNAINFILSTEEFLLEFENKGNAKVNIFKSLTAKVDLQNDYLVNLNSDSQKMNTVFLARLNQYKMFTNFTLDNNNNEAGIFVAMDGEANLDFLRYPISIPEIDLPFIDFHTPAISDLNLYEQTGLQNILTTTEQTVDVDAKITYQKSKAAPLVDMLGLIRIPSMGDLITDLSFKSAIINMNANAGLFTEDDLVFRLSATTASVFESLKAKLDGTTSLTTQRGIKLANSMSLENNHIESNHESTITMSTETFESALSVATTAKITLPILNLEAQQNLIADIKSKANAHSTLKMKGDFNIPTINADGKAEVDHSLKLEGTFDYVSMESSIKSNMDGRVFENYVVFGVLDNEENLYLNKDGLRSTFKVVADTKINQGETKVIAMDVNSNLAIEASMSRVYANLKHTCSNEVNLFSFSTNGKHNAQATIDFAPISSLTAGIEIDMKQPSSLGDFAIYKKAAADVTLSKQIISIKANIVSPLYTTNIEAEVEGNAPVFKVILKSSASSAIVVLEYDINASTTANFENDLLNLVSKLVLKHADLTVEVNHVIAQALRRKRQAEESVSRHTMNVDITSPAFADLNLRYAANRDAISASVSTPSGGFLGLQFSGKVPSQVNARIFGRYPSAPDADVEVLVIRSSKSSDKTNLQIIYNMEAPEAILNELKANLPSITSSVQTFADKYQITSSMEMLKDSVINQIREAHNVAVNYDIEISQLSIFFRNTIVQYQKNVQNFLDAIIKVLRETYFKVPGSDEMTTLPELLNKLTSSIANMLDVAIQIVHENTEEYYSYFVEKISTIKLQMPVGDAITGGQIIDKVKTAVKTIFDGVVDFVKNMESLDTMLEKMSETLKVVVEKTQEFVDSIKSDYLDAVLFKVNEFYREAVSFISYFVDQIPAFSMEDFNKVCESLMDMIIKVLDKISNAVNGFLTETSEEVQDYLKVTDGKLEINLPFHFQY